MRFLHLADLHLGKKINDYSLKDDQRHALLQALDLAKKEKVDAVIVAGDVYDSSLPTAEATEFYDWFLTSFHALGVPLLMISGNHDSPERLAVGSSLLKAANVHIVTKVEDSLSPITINGVDFYLLPHFRPSEVNRAFGTDARSFESAMKEVLSRIETQEGKPSVLITHQAILPVGLTIESSGSETALDVDVNGAVGGSETIDVKLFERFTYLALGHIHKAQNVGKNARYPGALLKYHIKEANAKRSFTVVDIEGTSFSIREFPIQLIRDVVVLEGTLEEVLAMPGNEDNFVHVRLTDEEFVDSPFAKLKARYPYCLGLEYPHAKPASADVVEFENVEEMDKAELFQKFFEQFGSGELDTQQKELVKRLLDEAEGKA
ncbi:MAG: exonuclease SbcCD subunit D [Bacilli bacterium]|nr:exonuclease SbcCD subunit D [Bacilli bacterium]